MKYLLFASLVFCLEGLSPDDIALEQSPDECFNSSVPKFTSALYSASIDVVGHHMSGLFFLKTMPDSSQRAVFSNEAGVTYFDFEWRKNGEFRVHRVIKKLKKKIVLNTLKKDFELVLVPPSIVALMKKKEANEYLSLRKKEQLIFKTNTDCSSITSIDVMGRKSKLVNVRFFPEGQNIPDSVSIVHFNFNMKIELKRLPQ